MIQNFSLPLIDDFETSSHQITSRKPILINDRQIQFFNNNIEKQIMEENKSTMESLCRQFFQKYRYSNRSFFPSTIASEFNAKLRRVYDMINILDGSCIIEKVEKRKYRWKGIQFDLIDSSKQNKSEQCSLRQISNKMKRLFSQYKVLTYNDLYGLIIKEKHFQINPATIRRRIYDCCKVFMFVGLIKKVGKRFYYGNLTQTQINNMNIQHQTLIEKVQKNDWSNILELKGIIKNQEITVQDGQVKYQQRNSFSNQINSKFCQKKKNIIKKVLQEIKNQKELDLFIYQLKNEFNKDKNVQMKQENLQENVFEQSFENSFYGLKQVQDENKSLLNTPVTIKYIQRYQTSTNLIFINNQQPLYSHIQGYQSLNLSSRSNFKIYPTKIQNQVPFLVSQFNQWLQNTNKKYQNVSSIEKD